MTALIRYGREDYAAIRRRWLDTLVYDFRRQLVAVELPAAGRMRFKFRWLEPDRKRDPDNVRSGGTKLILDALVIVGVLRADGAREVDGFDGDDYVYGGAAGVDVVARVVPVPGLLCLHVPHRLPDENEMLQAKELSARRSVEAKARPRPWEPLGRRGGFVPMGSVRR